MSGKPFKEEELVDAGHVLRQGFNSRARPGYLQVPASDFQIRNS